MEERVWRVMEAIPPMVRQVSGIIVRRTLSPKSSHGHTQPLDGSHPSTIVKMYISRMPSQNCGRQQQMFAVNVTAVSAGLPRFTALMMPKRIPSGTLMRNASTLKYSVTGTRSPIICSTGTLYDAECPKSPMRAFFSHST